MGIIVWVVAGLVLGVLASLLFGKRNMVLNGIAGVVGAALTGWIATLFGIGAWNVFSFVNLLIAAAGAAIVLFVAGKLMKYEA